MRRNVDNEEIIVTVRALYIWTEQTQLDAGL